MDYIKAEHAETERGEIAQAELQVSGANEHDYAGMLRVAVHDDSDGEMIVETMLDQGQARQLWTAVGAWLDSE